MNRVSDPLAVRWMYMQAYQQCIESISTGDHVDFWCLLFSGMRVSSISMGAFLSRVSCSVDKACIPDPTRHPENKLSEGITQYEDTMTRTFTPHLRLYWRAIAF